MAANYDLFIQSSEPIEATVELLSVLFGESVLKRRENTGYGAYDTYIFGLYMAVVETEDSFDDNLGMEFSAYNQAIIINVSRLWKDSELFDTWIAATLEMIARYLQERKGWKCLCCAEMQHLLFTVP